MSLRQTPFFLLTVLALAGCGGAAQSTDALGQGEAALTADDAAGVLDLVNYPGTDLAVLHDKVHLDIRAVHALLARRDGADQVCPSADDQPFTTLAELAQVRYLGTTGMRRLHDYAAAHPVPASEVVKRVTFTGWQAEAVVYGVNHASAADLDALLDRRAASNLASHRPFATVSAMGLVSYVGPTALVKLRGAADGWWPVLRAGGETGLAGVFDGVSFDEATAEVAVDIANNATKAQMTGHGIYATGANALVARRPFETLAEVAQVSGIGLSTMAALHRFAQSGDWSNPADSLTCVTDFQGAVAPQLGALLFMSESDRPLSVVAFPGQGKTAPTAAEILALTGAAAGSTTLVRDPAGFFGNLEPASGSSDAMAAASAASGAVVTAFGTLTDVTYVAVVPPADAVDGSAVQVYLVGRTACGDLVGLTSVSIET